MSYCTFCGKQISDTAKFCTGCGIALSPFVTTQIQEADYKQQSHVQKINKAPWMVASVAIILTIVTAVWALFFNKSKENKVDAGFTMVKLEKMNVLYIGVDNPVTVTGNGGDDKITAIIEGGGGSLSKLSPGKWIAKVTSITDNCHISVYTDGKSIATSDFNVRDIPDPVASIGGIISNENISVSQFKAQTGIEVYVKNFPFDVNYTVISFSLTADDENGDLRETSCTGNIWNTPAALNIINGLTVGKTVTIDNIKVKGPDGVIRKIPGLVYYIK